MSSRSESQKRYYEAHKERIKEYQREKQRLYRESIKEDDTKIEERRRQSRECKARQRQRKVRELLDKAIVDHPEFAEQLRVMKLIETFTEYQMTKAIQTLVSKKEPETNLIT